MPDAGVLELLGVLDALDALAAELSLLDEALADPVSPVAESALEVEAVLDPDDLPRLSVL